jgi:hypothetical protein
MCPPKRRQYKLYAHDVINEQLRESENIVRPIDLRVCTLLENEVRVNVVRMAVCRTGKCRPSGKTNMFNPALVPWGLCDPSPI